MSDDKFFLKVLTKACLLNKPSLVRKLSKRGCAKGLSDRVIRSCDWCDNFDILFELYSKGVFDLKILSVRAQKYINLRQKAEVRAVNKIGSWWIPICYDLKRECGKRMMERGWQRINNCSF